MLSEATTIPFPIDVDRSKLNIFPQATAQQHCEVESLLDRLGSLPINGWQSSERKIRPDVELHPSVLERFKAPKVQHANGWKPYRPQALRSHDQVKHFYEKVPSG
jgi:hypothetical protein